MKLCLQLQCKLGPAPSPVTAPLALWAPPCLGMSPHWPQSSHKPVSLIFSEFTINKYLVIHSHVWIHCWENILNTKTPFEFCWGIMMRPPSLTSVRYSLALIHHRMHFLNLTYMCHLPHLSIHGHRPKNILIYFQYSSKVDDQIENGAEQCLTETAPQHKACWVFPPRWIHNSGQLSFVFRQRKQDELETL